MIQKYPSRLLEKAIDQFATLPGVGRKTALRLALYLLRQPVENTRQFAAALVDLREHISYCRRCHNITTTTATSWIFWMNDTEISFASA